jgi:hypothetical protein
MNFSKATRKYESWLGEQGRIVRRDLERKHEAMRADPFSFLRATFYRWVQRWPKMCSELSSAPALLAVGDLHVENFGTWRDAEGRLIWGINDFDEASVMPYTNDLVRLAVSAHLAIAEAHLTVTGRDACDAILNGYSEGLDAGGPPFVLSEQHTWLRDIALSDLRDPARFWAKMDALETAKGKIPASSRRALERLLPARDLPYRLTTRVAGLGSLGHQRFVALAEWQGGKVAREAKVLVPSACWWVGLGGAQRRPFYQEIVDRAVRCRDPFVRLAGRWVVRRLAPDCSRIELADLPKRRDEARLLHAMGWETANVHLGSPKVIRAVRRNLARLRPDWLHAAAKAMVEATREDFAEWRRAGPDSSR